MTTDLTPAAWDYLADVARHCGMSWARVLRDYMKPQDGDPEAFIKELDGEPVACKKAADFISTKVTSAHRQEALL